MMGFIGFILRTIVIFTIYQIAYYFGRQRGEYDFLSVIKNEVNYLCEYRVSKEKLTFKDCVLYQLTIILNNNYQDRSKKNLAILINTFDYEYDDFIKTWQNDHINDNPEVDVMKEAEKCANYILNKFSDNNILPDYES